MANYIIELSPVACQEKLILSSNMPLQVTTKERNAVLFDCREKATKVQEALLLLNAKEMNTLLRKASDHTGSIQVSVVKISGGLVVPFVSRRKLYTFVNQE